jgi:hypothetical protein
VNGWIGHAALTPDVPALLRARLAGADQQELAGPGAVAAADALAAAGMGPALLARVAEAVRAAGIEAVAALATPVPDPAQSRLLRDYLAAAAGPGPDIARDAAMARWLGAVCVHLAVRRADTGLSHPAG